MVRALAFRPVRFLAIGTINTVIDFGVLNFLVSQLDMGRISANIVSTTIAMTFSFWANRTLVFKSNSEKYHNEAILFIAGTLFGLYVIQSIVIYALTETWTAPLGALADALPGIDRSILFTNAAKVAATVCTLFWNFFFYKHVVFRNDASSDQATTTEQE